mgnify:CR=1 FL=1
MRGAEPLERPHVCQSNRREVIMAQVQMLTLVDRGQDFSEWYVREGVVIDVQPFGAQVFLGSKVLTPITAVGQSINYVSRQGNEGTLNYPVEAIEIMGEDESAEVEGYARKWAERLGFPASDLGL